MNIRRSILTLFIFTIILGFIYTGLITLIAQIFFNKQANGDLIEKDGKIIGSYKIGQYFEELDHFWTRPSITNYESTSSINLLYNSSILEKERKKMETRIKETSENEKEVPGDLITFSASGIEAYISKEAAYYQVDRIVKYTNISREKIESIINNNLEKSYEGYIVNVLKINLELDKLKGE